MANNKAPVLVLCAEYQNQDTDESKTFDVVVKFKDQKQLELIEGTDFDTILELLSKSVQDRHGSDWFIDDVVEIARDGKESDIVDLDLTDFVYA